MFKGELEPYRNSKGDYNFEYVAKMIESWVRFNPIFFIN